MKNIKYIFFDNMIVTLLSPQALNKLAAQETRALKLTELAWDIQLFMEVSVA